MRSRWTLAVAAALVMAGVAAAVFYIRPGPGPTPDQPLPKPVTPTLYCEFYNFMHNAVVVSLNFAVSRDAQNNLAFTQLYAVEPDGTKTDYQDDPPVWTVGADDGTPVLTSPDAATRVVLYGLKPSVGGVFWTEAGIRSNTYRNLEGKCRQAHFEQARKRS